MKLAVEGCHGWLVLFFRTLDCHPFFFFHLLFNRRLTCFCFFRGASKEFFSADFEIKFVKKNIMTTPVICGEATSLFSPSLHFLVL